METAQSDDVGIDKPKRWSSLQEVLQSSSIAHVVFRNRGVVAIFNKDQRRILQMRSDFRKLSRRINHLDPLNRCAEGML
jgi:hypothetical protein